MIVTNTAFTPDAKWFARNNPRLIQLRDGDDLQKWIANDFAAESWRTVIRKIELCPGVEIEVPQFV
jgi:hypothetical protein